MKYQIRQIFNIGSEVFLNLKEEQWISFNDDIKVEWIDYKNKLITIVVNKPFKIYHTTTKQIRIGGN